MTRSAWVTCTGTNLRRISMQFTLIILIIRKIWLIVKMIIFHYTPIPLILKILLSLQNFPNLVKIRGCQNKGHGTVLRVILTCPRPFWSKDWPSSEMSHMTPPSSRSNRTHFGSHSFTAKMTDIAFACWSQSLPKISGRTLISAPYMPGKGRWASAAQLKNAKNLETFILAFVCEYEE